jgi:hypothetical protein
MEGVKPRRREKEFTAENERCRVYAEKYNPSQNPVGKDS